jgi:hypothetical protein
MSGKEYNDLWHYSEQFTRDPVQRSKLVTMAWQEGQKLGDRSTSGLMKSLMHFRAKELNKRSAFPLDEIGKRKIAVFRSHLKVPCSDGTHLKTPAGVAGAVECYLSNRSFLLSTYSPACKR